MDRVAAQGQPNRLGPYPRRAVEHRERPGTHLGADQVFQHLTLPADRPVPVAEDQVVPVGEVVVESRRVGHPPPPRKAECGGIEPPRPLQGRKPVLKTGRATRPTHSEQPRFTQRPFSTVGQDPSTPQRWRRGKYPHVAPAAGHPLPVGVLEPGLGVLAARPQPVAQPGEGDLTVHPTGVFYLFQHPLGGFAVAEKVPAKLHRLPALEQQPQSRRWLHRRRFGPCAPQPSEELLRLHLQLRGNVLCVRQTDPGIGNLDLAASPEQCVGETSHEAGCDPGLRHAQLGILRPLLRAVSEPP